MLPGLIFVFLKYAGKNEFSVPVYFEKGIENPPAECGLSYAKPYLLPDSLRKMAKMIHDTNVLVFPNVGLDFEKIESDIEDEFGQNTVWLMNAFFLTVDSTEYNRWKKCIFLVNDPSQSVLFDQEGRVRGYYDLRLRDEEDRLRVELKILLKKY